MSWIPLITGKNLSTYWYTHWTIKGTKIKLTEESWSNGPNLQIHNKLQEMRQQICLSKYAEVKYYKINMYIKKMFKNFVILAVWCTPTPISFSRSDKFGIFITLFDKLGNHGESLQSFTCCYLWQYVIYTSENTNDLFSNKLGMKCSIK